MITIAMSDHQIYAFAPLLVLKISVSARVAGWWLLVSTKALLNNR
jgi:hypothetical protein